MRKAPNYRILVLLLVLVAVLSGCGQASSGKLQVVATTSLLGSMVERLGGDKVSVTVITAPGACPGDFDVTPGQVQATAKAALLLKHGWPGEAFTDGLVAAAKNPKLQVVTLKQPGNWMTPPIQTEGVKGVADALAQVDPKNAALYRANIGPYLESIPKVGGEVKAKLDAAKTSQVKVIANDQQAGFLQWAGFQVIAIYGRAADLTPEKVKELMAKGKEAKVALVVDNLQSGPQTGVQMAQEMGAIQVTISNFPGGFDGTETWEKAIERNMEILLAAIAR